MGLLEQKYAKALVDAGKDKNILPQLRKDFKYFLDFLGRDRDFQFIFMSPVFPDEAQKASTHHIFEKKTSPVFMKFLDVLIGRGRERRVNNIYDEFIRLADGAENKVRVLLTTAVPIDNRQEETLNKTLSSKLGREVVIDKQTDASIIGGGIIKIGDNIIDGSLVNQLNCLQKELSRC